MTATPSMLRIEPSPEAVEPTPADPRLKGRVDAIEGGRLFGWAWDEAHAERRLTIRVVLDGEVVATAVADRPRIDLRRNGIGDGAHAFDVELSEAVLEARNRLEVTATCDVTGERLALRLPGPAELAFEAAVAAPLGRVLDRLEVLISAQRRMQLSHKELLERAGSAEGGVSRLATIEEGLDALLKQSTGAQEEIARKLAEIDIFFLRYDRTLADFDGKLKALGAEATRPLRRATTLLALLGLISAASSITAVALILGG